MKPVLREVATRYWASQPPEDLRGVTTAFKFENFLRNATTKC
jgi:hypothetical protein